MNIFNSWRLYKSKEDNTYIFMYSKLIPSHLRMFSFTSGCYNLTDCGSSQVFYANHFVLTYDISKRVVHTQQSAAHGTAPLHWRHQGKSARHRITLFNIIVTGATRQIGATANAQPMWHDPPSVTSRILVKVQLPKRLTVLLRIP